MRNGSLVKDHNSIPLGSTVCVRVPHSHRKTEKFVRQLGRKPEYHFSFHFDGNFVYVTGEEYERVKPYVTRARVDFDKLLKCWNG